MSQMLYLVYYKLKKYKNIPIQNNTSNIIEDIKYIPYSKYYTSFITNIMNKYIYH